MEAQKQLLAMQESLEREQTAALERMKGKISETRASHKVALESARKEFLVEKEKMLEELETLRKEKRSTIIPTQVRKREKTENIPIQVRQSKKTENISIQVRKGGN